MNEYYVDKLNKTVNFIFRFNENIKNSIKEVGDSRWNSETKEWIISINDYTKEAIVNIIKKHNFKKRVDKKELKVNYNYSLSESRYKELEALCNELNFNWNPRSYQIEFLEYALQKGSFILGDAVGTGKTYQSILYTELTKSFPCLVIVPGSVKYNWLKKWTEIVGNGRTVSAIESSPKKGEVNNWSADVVIINYDIIGKKQGNGTSLRFSELKEIDWRMLICDEAHFLKEKKSQRSQAVKKIVKKDNLLIQFLTGTAIMSKPIEIWNLLVLLNKQKLIANDWMQFILRYCGGYKGNFGWVYNGATNILELNKKIRDNLYIRREKKDVLKELPNVIKQVIEVPITNLSKIKKATNNLIKYLKENVSEEASEKAMEAEHLVAISVLRKLSIEGKLKAIEQYIKDWKTSTDEKLLIFGIHKEPLEKLSNKFNSRLISGGISSKNKQAIVENWINNSSQFLFANMDAAGTGVDGLQDICSNMIIIELPWNYSDIEQTIGRLHRSGQKLPPNINFLLNYNTIDKEMFEILQHKEAVSEAVNKGVDIASKSSNLKQILKKVLQNRK